MRTLSRQRRTAVLAVLATLLAGSVQAQAPSLATYEGADRLERIVAAAKLEGELSIYTSTPVDDIQPLIDAFERRYGIRTKVWRASSEKVLQRGVVEARAGRHDVDIFETNGPELEALVREKLLLPVNSPASSSLVPEAIFAHRSWVGTRLLIFTIAYNTNLVHKSDLPAHYEGFVDGKWKGKLGIEAEDADWFATVSGVMGETSAQALFRGIVAANGVSLRKGHTLLANLVASGEVPVALTVYNYKAQQLKNRGAPIDWYVIAPAIARLNGVGVAAQARHPNAALLWYEFEIGDEGQRLLVARDFVPTSRAIDTPLNRLPLRLVDSKAVLDEADKWARRYAEIFGGPSPR